MCGFFFWWCANMDKDYQRNKKNNLNKILTTSHF